MTLWFGTLEHENLQKQTNFCENYVISYADIANLGQVWVSGIPEYKIISQNRPILSEFLIWYCNILSTSILRPVWNRSFGRPGKNLIWIFQDYM